MRSHKKSGFTLIELTVALSIAVVLAGIVLVRVEGWTSRQALHSRARAFGNTIRTWREKAQLEETSYILRIDPDKGTWNVFAEGVRQPVRKGALGRGQLFERFIIGEKEFQGPVALVFGPRGILLPTEITLANGDGDVVVLSLEGLVNEVSYAPKQD